MTTTFEVAVGLVLSVMLTRIYGASVYGHFVLVYAVTSLAFAVSDLGAKSSLIRFVPQRIKEGREVEAVSDRIRVRTEARDHAAERARSLIDEAVTAVPLGTKSYVALAT